MQYAGSRRCLSQSSFKLPSSYILVCPEHSPWAKRDDTTVSHLFHVVQNHIPFPFVHLILGFCFTSTLHFYLPRQTFASQDGKSNDLIPGVATNNFFPVSVGKTLIWWVNAVVLCGPTKNQESILEPPRSPIPPTAENLFVFARFCSFFVPHLNFMLLLRDTQLVYSLISTEELMFRCWDFAVLPILPPWICVQVTEKKIPSLSPFPLLSTHNHAHVLPYFWRSNQHNRIPLALSDEVNALCRRRKAWDKKSAGSGWSYRSKSMRQSSW